MPTTKKLIEVALPLEAINVASAREKSIRHGHPSTLHLWWARRPLAACRAVLFASLVDDPSSHPEQFPTDADQQRERERLFRIIEELVQWENSNNERVLGAARAEIMRSTDGNPPPVYDPFAGGGSIPLEAQRLGLEAHASDLNPVAVLINKALIEIPPKFANVPPVNPEDRNRIGAEWKGAAGLAADVRYYGKWMRDEAEKRIGHLYPKVKLPKEYGGGEATVIAWLWTRTVKCPNPACGARMPLVRSFALSTKKGRETWAEPVIIGRDQRDKDSVRFEIHYGKGKPQEGSVNRRGARCVVCGTIASLDHVRGEGRAGRMGEQMMAIVAGGQRGRIYLPPNEAHERTAASAQSDWRPEERVTTPSHDVDRLPMYGMHTWGEVFTNRQLVVITTMIELIRDVFVHAQRASQSYEYARSVATYLAFAVDKMIDRNTSLCNWENGMDRIRGTFGRQALAMVWDFAETNPFAGAGGDLEGTVESLCEVLDELVSGRQAQANQHNAMDERTLVNGVLLSTDPPYYDNIGYADLSDFFYVWLRRSLKEYYPELFSTLLVPKSEELIAAPHRFGGNKQRSAKFFEQGLTQAFGRMHLIQNEDFPLTIYYAFKQSESDEGDSDEKNDAKVLASTGWETMLEGLIQSGFGITGTWPMRSELASRNVSRDSNALASSIVLVCRPRPEDAKSTTRLEFIRALRRELPEALRLLQKGNIAPVDLAQAAIGPGMAVFSRYSKVLESDGAAMRVRTALQLINQALDEVLAEQEGEYDVDTRWAIAWFDQFGVDEGAYGTAETLSKAKNTSVAGMAEAGIVAARAGKVRLLKRDELPANWEPAGDARLTAWETVQHLVRALDTRGEQGAAELLARIPSDVADVARDLAYRLYITCERKKWAEEALAYNALVVAWPEIARLAAESKKATPVQGRMEL